MLRPTSCGLVAPFRKGLGPFCSLGQTFDICQHLAQSTVVVSHRKGHWQWATFIEISDEWQSVRVKTAIQLRISFYVLSWIILVLKCECTSMPDRFNFTQMKFNACWVRSVAINLRSGAFIYTLHYTADASQNRTRMFHRRSLLYAISACKTRNDQGAFAYFVCRKVKQHRA